MCLIRGMGFPPELVHASMRLFGFCSKGPSEAERYYVELTEVVKQEERSGSGPPQDGLRGAGRRSFDDGGSRNCDKRAFRVRAPGAIAASGDRQHDRHHDRVV